MSESETWLAAARILRMEADAALSVTVKRILRRIALRFEEKAKK